MNENPVTPIHMYVILIFYSALYYKITVAFAPENLYIPFFFIIVCNFRRTDFKVIGCFKIFIQWITIQKLIFINVIKHISNSEQ